MLGKNSEVGIRRVVEDGGGEEAARGGDQGGGSAKGLLRIGYEPVVKNPRGRARDIGFGIRVNIDIVQRFLLVEKEPLPERRELKVGVGEEQERDFELGG